MEKVYKIPACYNRNPISFCPGCTSGIITKLIMQVVDELDIQKSTIVIGGVGCCGKIDKFFNCDAISPMHGRALAVATGVKRARPDLTVFTLQGDGDSMAIGMAETVHAAMRGEKLTMIVVNNTVYGATGGQMAPTTLVGQKATTAPEGRQPELAGYPIHLCEMIATLKGSYYVERVAVDSVPHVNAAKRAIKKGFQNQLDGNGFNLVEILTACPTNWGMTPEEAVKRIRDEMIPEYPLGVFKDGRVEPKEEVGA